MKLANFDSPEFLYVYFVIIKVTKYVCCCVIVMDVYYLLNFDDIPVFIMVVLLTSYSEKYTVHSVVHRTYLCLCTYIIVVVIITLAILFWSNNRLLQMMILKEDWSRLIFLAAQISHSLLFFFSISLITRTNSDNTTFITTVKYNHKKLMFGCSNI